MGRYKTGREIQTILRLSTKGREALEYLTEASGLSSMNAYIDKLLQKLKEKDTPLVTRKTEKNNDED